MADLLFPSNLADNADFIRRVEAALCVAAINVKAETVNEVQTLSVTGIATAGNITLSGGPLTGNVVVPWNTTAGGLASLLAANAGVGLGNVAVTGGPLPGTPLVVTWFGALGGMAIAVMTLTHTLTGTAPVPAVARTTLGVGVVNSAVRKAFASKVLANPLGYAQQTAPAVAANVTVQGNYAAGSFALNVSESIAGDNIQFQVNSIWNALS